MTDPKPVHTDERLETPKQLAARVGLTERQIRHLVETRQLEHVMIGCRVLIPVTAFANFLEAKKVKPWPDATKDHDSVGSTSARAFTSPGPNTAAAASAQLARQTAHKLKSFSRNGCNTEAAEPAQVIPLKSS
jgi:excisionase family DNA binding protein